MNDIWNACNGVDHIQPLNGTLYRLVESQEQIATMSYVDTLEEQAILESLLDTSKPPYQNNSDDYHYLLKTPFRYPPLPWGSRFGTRNEPSLFYAGCDETVTLYEAAYYRFIFWLSMDAEPPKASIKSEHTLFSTDYKTDRGIKLNAPPFDAYSTALTNKTQYTDCQALGTAMRDAEIQAFTYSSARYDQGECIALFTPQAFVNHEPSSMHRWLCELTSTAVIFKAYSSQSIISINLSEFLVNGLLPKPSV